MTRKPKPIEDHGIATTPNPLRDRDPDLVDNLTSFRGRIGDLLLDTLAPMFADSRSRAEYGPGFLAELHAAAQVLRVLVKEKWTEQDLDTFDKYWRDAMRSEIFADEFEAERHRIQACVNTARTSMIEQAEQAIPSKTTQPTLW